MFMLIGNSAILPQSHLMYLRGVQSGDINIKI